MLLDFARMFYGPGGPYALFAGKDASRALAKMSFEDKDLTGDISGLGPFELDALQDWEYKFMSKYVKVGTVKKEEVPVTDGASSEQPPAESADDAADKPAVEADDHDAKPAEVGPSGDESKEEWDVKRWCSYDKLFSRFCHMKELDKETSFYNVPDY